MALQAVKIATSGRLEPSCVAGPERVRAAASRTCFVACALMTGCIAIAACGHTHIAPASPPTATPASTAGDVEALYARGEAQRRRGLYQEALTSLGEVKTKYPYSRYAPLAELRMADVHFEHEHYVEAIDGYRTFLRFHPAHGQAPYALTQVGAAYFRQIPRDWWFLPPAAEREQDNVRQAIEAYQDLLQRFGSADPADQARRHLDACRRKLADHEMYVARFYAARHQHRAAAQRAEGLLADYAGLGLDAEALWLAGTARLSLGDKPAARVHLERLVAEYKTAEQAPRARKALQVMGFLPFPANL